VLAEKDGDEKRRKPTTNSIVQCTIIRVRMEQYWNITIVQVSIPVLPHKNDPVKAKL